MDIYFITSSTGERIKLTNSGIASFDIRYFDENQWSVSLPGETRALIMCSEELEMFIRLMEFFQK